MATTATMIAAPGASPVGEPLPKQYRQLTGRTVTGHSVRRFATHLRVGSVCVVIDPVEPPLYDDAMQGDVGAEADTLLTPVTGHATRQHSVWIRPELTAHMDRLEADISEIRAELRDLHGRAA